MTLGRGHDRIGDEGIFRAAGCGLAIAISFVALMLACGATAPTFAQDGWMPTVATTIVPPMDVSPNGTVRSAIDPRFFPSARVPAAPLRGPPPQGAWSPIVTGALPTTASRPPHGAAAAGAGLRGRQDAFVPPIRANAPANQRPGPAIAAAATTNPGSDGAGAADAGGPAGAAPGGLWDAAMTPAGGTPVKKHGPLDALPPNATAAQQYCFNTADSAAEARFAWQAKKIQEMEVELDKRSQQLEAKTQDYKRWLERRDEFARKAHEKLVGFYSKMRPDAAALQLATINEEIAAAVLTKLDTKVASQIMGEMDPAQAAKIASLISGASKIPPEAKYKPGDQGGAKPPVPEGAAPPEQPRS